MRILGSAIVILGTIAGLTVLAKDQQVVDTTFSGSTKLLATAMGGNA